MTPPPDGLRKGQGRAGLVAASGGSRFVRHYAFVDDDPTWYAVPDAVGFSGTSLSGHLSCHLCWTLVGDDAGVAILPGRRGRRLGVDVDDVVRGSRPRGVVGRMPGPVRDPVDPCLHRPALPHVGRRPRRRHPVVRRPVRRRGPRCRGRVRARPGAGYLSSVAVASHLRGRGLGRLLTAYLTRHGVTEHGLSTLALFSDHDAALALYRSLGYVTEWRFASRAVVPRS